jgi:hypothetical protein
MLFWIYTYANTHTASSRDRTTRLPQTFTKNKIKNEKIKTKTNTASSRDRTTRVPQTFTKNKIKNKKTKTKTEQLVYLIHLQKI